MGKKKARILRSPYTTVAITLSIGRIAKRYTVLQEFLEQCSALINKLRPYYNRIELSELDDNIGHTLVHFLYTGAYQILKLRGVSEDVERITEYKRTVLIYHAARTYGLGDLKILAKTYIRILEEGISQFDFLNIAREFYPKFPENDIWFPDYLKKIKIAFEADNTLFSKKRFLDGFGKGLKFDKTLVRIIVEIYTDKISGMVSKVKSAVEEAPCDEAPYDETAEPPRDESPCDEPAEPPCDEPAEPSCDEPAEPSCDEPAEPSYDEPAEPSYDEPAEPSYDKPAEPPCDEPPCDEPAKSLSIELTELVRDEPIYEIRKKNKKDSAQYSQNIFPPASEPEYILETEAALESAVNENGLCVLRARHLFHEKM